ncbi:MAG: heavy-metal-associated domain-containing protein [Bacteroidota bacterium]
MKQIIFILTVVVAFTLTAAEKTKTVSLNIKGMTCESCAGTVQKALKKVDGVKEAKVDLKNNKATVTLASATTTSDMLVKAVSDAGFTATEGAGVPKMETKKKMGEEECKGDCCDDEGGKTMKHSKAKKGEMKKS